MLADHTVTKATRACLHEEPLVSKGTLTGIFTQVWLCAECGESGAVCPADLCCGGGGVCVAPLFPGSMLTRVGETKAVCATCTFLLVCPLPPPPSPMVTVGVIVGGIPGSL